ncbi:hypothetical protein J1P26_09060 [Neobacillus sp. MM2021_6]|uniref:hypothetical protein n=1 Tax=Bacillaceae TaxID=186817 RepID=UPI00140AB27D|nr:MULTISPECIES: hypothetical protein [Bacillaceae]MBO0959873.1 hypothetical protein [Neobacillus sp. MM2021_6]NHC20479.1 hypothetical protein [Bacillus sp. MM2020_4]
MNKFKKSILTFVAISSVSVVSVMANQDVAAQLEKWYNTAYQKSSETTLQGEEKGLREIKDTTKELQHVVKDQAVSDIGSFLLTTLNQSKGSIENHQKEFQSRLYKAKAELEQDGFDVHAENEKATLDAEMTADVEEMLSEVLGE